MQRLLRRHREEIQQGLVTWLDNEGKAEPAEAPLVAI
jgi:hypothetical protein